MPKVKENPFPSVKQQIEAFIAEEIKSDETFAEDVKKSNKSVDECMKYIFTQAKKYARTEGGCRVCASITSESDKIIFGWIKHYYHEDKVDIEPGIEKQVKATAGKGDAPEMVTLSLFD